ncbi:MAG: FapA family protein [Spirochaetaceae bacterium]|jgi:uncharacterized protein (DUF342 family)|nr:FapA family protein [Spirochaetaceae bacterium]
MKSSGKTTISSGRNEGRVILDFSEDDMEVYGDFIPAVQKGVPIKYEYIKELLERVNVCNGVFWDKIEEAMNVCNETCKPVKKVLIARGNIPVPESPAHFHLEDSVRKPARPKFEEGAQTNYRAFSPFIIVRKGQTLARSRPAVAGIDGKTVHGVTVPFGKNEVMPLSAGKNVLAQDDKICAALDGLFIISNNTLNVEPELKIKGSVGYATGNIEFPGNVTLDGTVNDGFKVKTGGNLTVRETLDATDIIVQGDMQVRGGMIGRDRALVKVSGNLNARFIQNCKVACKKNITASTEIINSTLYTMDSINAGDKGTLLGGEFFAFHSIRCGRIGKANSLPVKLHLGSDWTLLQEIESNKNMLRLLNAKMEQVSIYLAGDNLDAAKMAKVKEMETRLNAEILKCKQKREDLRTRYIIDREAVLVCYGAIAAGTLIEICGVEFSVEEALNKTRIALDKTSGRIVPMPL